MSVLIKDMKMPEDCPVCPLAHWNKLDSFTGCELRKRYFDKEDMETKGRPDFCPLVELKPHGRLIDADAPIVLTDANGREIEVTVSHIIERNYGEIVSVIEAEEVSE